MNDEMRMNLYWPDAGWKAECHEERSQGKCRSNPDEIFYEGAAVSSIWMTRNPNNTLYIHLAFFLLPISSLNAYPHIKNVPSRRRAHQRRH